MFSFLPGWFFGLLAFLLYFVNTVLWIGLLLLAALVKILLPLSRWRQGCDDVILACGRRWIAGCNWLTATLYDIAWEIEGEAPLDPQQWYLVVANHQSWVDVMVFMAVFGHRLPFPKVFSKREILWLPFIGAAVWALGFPLLKRYPQKLLERRPELRGHDREIARQACRRATARPTTLVNFLEGTRLTPAKHAARHSPFRHLLPPRAGGVALVDAVLGEKLAAVVDLTIVYPAGRPTFWHFLCGRVRRVTVRLREVPVPPALRQGDYETDAGCRDGYQRWVTQLWQEKDVWMDAKSSGLPAASGKAGKR
ncbi:MAG: hypothetical protein A2091_03180 [Desulfuromonadales bacterium GWD2_61_12]|nr:MAG: hypothetical protein A2005_10715 [Desulfuromonadales bacterium GWC2_61_20]OGR34428.1 MAG: hypothetical protein A2091_03180 [Desulfuromonadales bacterium GWD2_61_12]HAD05470.1 acyltransferase [Desulfuromonas sp.]HBT84058.1 acyltransferase [Desulfuromonas sp.]